MGTPFDSYSFHRTCSSQLYSFHFPLLAALSHRSVGGTNVHKWQLLVCIAGSSLLRLPSISLLPKESLKQIFNEAFEDGTMEGFFKLISFYQTQSEPAYCGLASLSMVLNALAIDPGRKWKGNLT
ncbi:Glutathione gamma-glutamylcysteinyltransferase 2 [Linum perenne]